MRWTPMGMIRWNASRIIIALLKYIRIGGSTYWMCDNQVNVVSVGV
jgi:hypothetical protein